MSAVTARRVLGLGVVPLALLLGGCLGGDPDEPRAGADGLPDCAEATCAAEVASYAEAVARLPGVARVGELTYVAEQITDEASVAGEVWVEGDPAAACAELEESLGEQLWRSDISPVGSVQLQCYGPDATGPSDFDYAAYSLLDVTDQQAEQWGPRGSGE